MRVKASDLNVGDVFYECERGQNLRMTVVEPVVYENSQWVWVSEDENGEKFDYLITDGYEHYGPQIYSEPQYI